MKAILAYLALRGPAVGLLCIFRDGFPLSRLDLVRAVRSALDVQGVDIWRFNGHSFRIGAATTAAACGIEDSLIQALGCWKSSPFTTYIQTPKESLISVSSILLSSTWRWTPMAVILCSYLCITHYVFDFSSFFLVLALRFCFLMSLWFFIWYT